MKSILRNMARPLLTVLFFLTAAACTPQTAVTPGLLQASPPQAPSEQMTLLPMLDLRPFPSPELSPDLTLDTAVVIPADEIMDLAENTWKMEGFWSALREYQGPPPDSVPFQWRDFPMRGLGTDLALGLEIRKLDLKKVGQNFLMIPHAVVDAALLPVFSAGLVFSNGNTDLGARALPSSMVKFTVQADLNVLSLSGGGPIFTKTYFLELTDPAVTETALTPGFLRSPKDGQAYGREVAPILINDLFATMARDPELTFLPDYAHAAWLRRVLAHEGVAPALKAQIADRSAENLTVPRFSADEIQTLAEPYAPLPEKAAAVLAGRVSEGLEPYVPHPAWIEEKRSLVEVFGLNVGVVVEAAGNLIEIQRLRPLSDEEQQLRQVLESNLDRWAGTTPGANHLQEIVKDREIGWPEKRAALEALVRQSKALENERFIRGRKAIWLRVMELPRAADTADLRESALTMLTALRTAGVVDDFPVARPELFAALTGRDDWAAPMVMDALRSGNFDPEVASLASAMRIEEAGDMFRAIVNKAAREVWIPGRVMEPPRPEIPLHPSGPRIVHNGPYPDPALAARALGAYKGRADAAAVLKKALAGWPESFGITEATAAEAAAALGRLDDGASIPMLFSIWARLVKQDQGAAIRQAILNALAETTGRQYAPRVLTAVRPLMAADLPVPGAVREAVDFFGRVRYNEAVPLMAEILDHPAPGLTAGQSALNALSRIASPQAEEVLKSVVDGLRRDLAPEARKAWESLVMEAALWRELDRR